MALMACRCGMRCGVMQPLTPTSSHTQSERNYSPFVSYTLSKLATLITAKELQRRFER